MYIKIWDVILRQLLRRRNTHTLLWVVWWESYRPDVRQGNPERGYYLTAGTCTLYYIGELARALLSADVFCHRVLWTPSRKPIYDLERFRHFTPFETRVLIEYIYFYSALISSILFTGTLNCVDYYYTPHVLPSLHDLYGRLSIDRARHDRQYSDKFVNSFMFFFFYPTAYVQCALCWLLLGARGFVFSAHRQHLSDGIQFLERNRRAFDRCHVQAYIDTHVIGWFCRSPSRGQDNICISYEYLYRVNPKSHIIGLAFDAQLMRYLLYIIITMLYIRWMPMRIL